MADVCLCAKIRILKQITTSIGMQQVNPGCLSLCKDTNFKANHNDFIRRFGAIHDVCLCAKIRILKQITTKKKKEKFGRKMFVFVQRYEF